MPINAYPYVDLFSRVVSGADHLLTKGEAHAAATGVSQSEMLGWRLIEDMHPLSFQLAVVCNFSRQWPARFAGLDLPKDVGFDLTAADYHAALADAKAYLAALTPEQFEGRDDTPLTVTLGNGMAPTLPAGQWLTVFAATNLYFHLSTAYDILRAKGAPIGKVDLFPGGL
jgi:hypothetical protein